MTDYQKITEKKGEWLTQLAGQASTTSKMFLTGDLDLGDKQITTNSMGQFNALETFQAWTAISALMNQLGFFQNVVTPLKGFGYIYSGTCDVRFETFKYYSE